MNNSNNLGLAEQLNNISPYTIDFTVIWKNKMSRKLKILFRHELYLISNIRSSTKSLSIMEFIFVFNFLDGLILIFNASE